MRSDRRLPHGKRRSDPAGWNGYHKCSIRARIEAGLGYVPVDRYRDGMVMDMTLAENMFLKSSFSARWAGHGVINRKALEAFTAEQLQEHRVKAGGPGDFARSCPAAINRKSCWPERSISAAVFWFSTSRHEGWIWARSTGSTSHFAGARERESRFDDLNGAQRDLRPVRPHAVMYKGRMMGIYENGSRSAAQIGLLMAGISEEQEGAQA